MYTFLSAIAMQLANKTSKTIYTPLKPAVNTGVLGKYTTRTYKGVTANPASLFSKVSL